MADADYEAFVRRLQVGGAKPFVTSHAHKRRELLDVLDRELRRGKFTLVLGAGASVPSGLPSWDTIVKNLTTAALPGAALADVAKQLAGMDLPAYRKTRILESLVAGFRLTVRDALYPARLRVNHTLASVADLAKRCRSAGKRLQIVTYNFDDLLERHLDDVGLKNRYLVVSSQAEYATYGRTTPMLTVFHPHGYLPMRGDLEQLLGAMLVFSERQYHRSYFAKSHWTSTIQNSLFGSTACLFVGCSFNDQNLRRLLDQSNTAASPALVSVMKKCGTFSTRRKNEATDFIIQHDLSLLDVKTLWVKGYGGVPAILGRLLS